MRRPASRTRPPHKNPESPRRGRTRAGNYVPPLVAAALILIAGSSAYAWYTFPHATDVSYQPCEIEYGEVVGEWSGQDEEPWNRRDHHYQLREFSLRAHAPGVFFPNAAETEPTRIATGGPDACRPGFGETVDMASESYRWRGARATGIRLGAPAASPVSPGEQLPSIARPPDTGLETPVFPDSAGAAVWVDDGGAASVTVGKDSRNWWCINHRRCGDITDQRPGTRRPARAAGYQYTRDNCPAGVECSGAWYQRPDLSEFVRGSDGLLGPFDLRLSAVSTFADTVGSAVLVAFRYPAETTVEAEISGGSRYLEPGGAVSLTVSMQKKGPAVDSLVIIPEADGHPLENPSPAVLGGEQIETLNATDSLSVPVQFPLRGSAPRGACHTLPVTIKDTAAGDTLGTAETSYCIAAADVTYTYDIRTRGDIGSDPAEFKRLVAETLRDRRGWAAAGVAFTRAPAGGDFTLWLASPQEVAGFSSGCDATYSCRVGSDVIINDERWRNATPAWNEAGGSLRDYRHLVVNHEVGHFLGLGHRSCPGPDRPAPVMMQQSIALGGCRINPWPLAGEIDRI